MLEIMPTQPGPGEITYSTAARNYAAQSMAANTARAYKSGWAQFVSWRGGDNSLPVPVAVVVEYLTYLGQSGHKIASAKQARAAIAAAHRAAGLPSPTESSDVITLLKGMSRALGSAKNKKQAVTLADLRAMVGTFGDDLQGKRDKALLLVGFWGAFRRSELVTLEVADLRRAGPDVLVTIRRSKTDQSGQGKTKLLPANQEKNICPVAALLDWLDAARIASGPVFRSFSLAKGLTSAALDSTGQTVALIVKRAAQDAGLDWRRLAGHSLRSGFITESLAGGASMLDVMEQSGHANMQTLTEYYQASGVSQRRAASCIK